MSTLRVSGPLYVGRGPMGMLVRMLAVSSLLCAVVFAAGFALGRAERPRAASGEPLATSLPAAAAGPAIPLALGSAPTIALEVPVAQSSTAHARPRVTVVRSVAPVTLPASVPAAPSAASTPAAEAPVSTTAPVTPANPRTQSSGGSSHANGGTKSETGGGTSFDSSG